MDIVELYERSLDEFVRRVREVGPGQWDLPTPCQDWNVKDLVNHVVYEERWVVPLMQGATVAEVDGRYDGDLLGTTPAVAAADAAREAKLAVAAPGALEQEVHLSFGDTPAQEYVRQLLADHLIHAWDLAAATGGDTRLDPQLVGACAEWFAEREDMYRQAGAIGPRAGTPPGAGEQERLIAAFGRDPAWQATLGILDRFNAAFARCDVDAIMVLMADDCVFESTSPAPDGRRHEGAAAVRAAWEELFSTSREPSFEVEELSAWGERAVQRWRYAWRNEDGTIGHVRGVDVFRLRDGKVVEKLSYVKG